MSPLYFGSAVAQDHIGDNGGGHGFEDDGDSGAEAGVVPSVDNALGGFAVFAGALLGLGDGGGRFYCDAEDDGFAVGNSAENTACVIGDISVVELVVILTAAHGCDFKSASELDSLHSADGERGLG